MEKKAPPPLRSNANFSKSAKGTETALASLPTANAPSVRYCKGTKTLLNIHEQLVENNYTDDPDTSSPAVFSTILNV